jgi:hypothetical protein
MVSIILVCNEKVKAEALANGFREETVLVRHNGCMSTEDNKQKLERELFKMRPYQFLVSDFWGAGEE